MLIVRMIFGSGSPSLFSVTAVYSFLKYLRHATKQTSEQVWRITTQV